MPVETPLLSTKQKDDVERGKANAEELGRVVGCSAGLSFTLLLTASGKVFGCGQNDRGQLGLGKTTRSSAFSPTPTFLPLLDNYFVAAVSSGYHHSLARLDDGRLLAWGSNSWGQLGRGLPALTANKTVFSASPDFVVGFAEQLKKGDAADADSGLETVATAIDCGAFHSAAVTAARSLFVWGRNNYGQLGLGDAGIMSVEELRPYYQTAPKRNPIPTVFFAVSLGAWHSMALGAVEDPTGGQNGTAIYVARTYVWGRNDKGYGILSIVS